jgi:hypothetical protein
LVPYDLTGVERVGELDILGRSTGGEERVSVGSRRGRKEDVLLVVETHGDGRLGSEGLDTDEVDLVSGLDAVVVRGVREREGEETLLLTVGLVDTSERPGDDGASSKESGLEGGVLSGRSLSVVLIRKNVVSHGPRVPSRQRESKLT